MAMGRVMIATSAERRCSKNTIITSETMRISSLSVRLKVSIDRSIRPERSYTGIISTPSGRDALTSSKRALTRFMTSKAFSPKRMTTIPPTAKPSPLSSALPRCSAGPSDTVAMSDTVTGIPSPVVRRTTLSRSAVEVM